jgi:hypothetical protein
MPPATGRNVYLIRQRVDRLCGEHLDRAVVIAAGPGRAVKALLRYVRTYRPAAIARRSRLIVLQIGENPPDRLESVLAASPDDGAVIVAVVYGDNR